MTTTTDHDLHHWRDRTMHEYGFRAFEDLTPGVDFVWLPSMAPNVKQPLEFGRVLSVTPYTSKLTGWQYLEILCERPDGRTASYPRQPHHHIATYYAGPKKP